MPVLDLRCTLKGSRPAIWREVRLPAELKLGKLHKVMQLLFGWFDYHLHSFEQGKVSYEDHRLADGWDEPEGLDYRNVAVGQLLRRPKDKLIYRYDFGDDWQVELVVLSVGSDDLEADLLGGARSGPPEDCGGVDGLHHLNRVLASPRHEEYESLREWAGGYEPADFPLEALRKALRRMFKKKAPRPAVVPRPAPAMERHAPALEDYELGKLTPRQAMVAALLEQGAPMSLEELQTRLERAGFPLSLGLESLRRAWKADLIFRSHQDGRLELDLDHPDFWRFDMDLLKCLRPLPEWEKQPLRWEELEVTNRLRSLTRVQVAVAVLDAEGGAFELERLQAGLTRLEQNFKLETILPKLPRQGNALDVGSPEVALVRRVVRRGWERIQVHQAAQAWEATEIRRLQAEPGYLVVAAHGRAVVRSLGEGTQQNLEGDKLAALLRGASACYAVDPFLLFEQCQVSVRPGQHRYPLLPLEHYDGARQYRPGLTVEEFIRPTLGCCYPAGCDLAARVPYLARLLAYGRLHGEVWGPDGPVPVWWNPTNEPELRARLELACAERTPVSLAYRPADPLQPELSLRPYALARLLEQHVLTSDQKRLELRHIYLCEGEGERSRFRVTHLSAPRVLLAFAQRSGRQLEWREPR